ncbi:diaminopimelate decarboxylase [Microbacterium sp.]|uniref:diaminopimelate decarboxylase n=1 Tax=Microbacterium sp. TaxID=51671 RepID=UPI003F9B3E7D
MSADNSPVLAPEWLAVPDDPNDLAAGVWPITAHRTGDGELNLGGVDASDLRAEFGTPLLVLDEEDARARAGEAHRAFTRAAASHGTEARVYYAGKAFLSVEVARWMIEAGLNVDVCSRGELEIALAAGVPADRIGFHGNNKLVSELVRAVEVGVGTIIVDSDVEIERLGEIASRFDAVQSVLVRVRSGVHADTHEFLATAHEDQKFGFSLPGAERAVERIREFDGLRFLGLHCHIGSQIFGVDGFRESAARVLELHARLLEGGDVPVMNLGGGFGIAYTRADEPTPIAELAGDIVAAVAEECFALGVALPALAFEPGRSIIGPSGVSLYEVGTTKAVELDGGERTYISVDGGMSDNARPALYGAQYSARLASRSGEGEPALSRVVGLHCESGDIVVDHEYLPSDVGPGDLLAVPVTGAYCAALSSNYNHTPRPPIVAVRRGAARLLVRGETLDDLLARDIAYTTEAADPEAAGEGEE